MGEAKNAVERLLSYAVDARFPDWWDNPIKLRVVAECARAIYSKLTLAEYDANRMLEFRGYESKVLRYWAERALTAEQQLKEAGIERQVPGEG